MTQPETTGFAVFNRTYKGIIATQIKNSWSQYELSVMGRVFLLCRSYIQGQNLISKLKVKTSLLFSL